MFKKVLITEDMEDINKGVYAMLTELGIVEIEQVQYCDDAYLKIQKAIRDDKPFDLLISDLSFATDHRTQKYTSGEALITKVKKEIPSLKIIVYSVEDKLQKVRSLFTNQNIDAYVCKSRQGLKNLSHALTSVFDGTIYLSPEVQNALTSIHDLEINDYDIMLLNDLANGLTQDEISDLYSKNQISPASRSSIEKRLTKLRLTFNANNAIQLVAIVKDLGLI